MREKLKTLSQQILSLQKKRFYTLVLWIIGVATLLVGMGYILRSHSSDLEAEELVLHDVSKDIDDPNAWLFRNEAKIRKHGDEQQKLKSDLQKLQASASRKDAEIQLKNQLVEQNKKLEALSAQLKTLSQTKSQNFMHDSTKVQHERSNSLPQNQSPTEHLNPYDLYPPENYFNGRRNEALFGRSAKPNNADPNHTQQNQTVDNGLLDVKFTPVTRTQPNRSKNINAYLPANTLVEAVLLSGVDASAGIDSQKQPQPVVLRVTNFANFPNKMRGALKSCRVGAQAWGEISSERAYIRPDTLSCVKKDGTVLETNVKGFVAGSDGKVGVRGKVVMRDGAMIARSFFGGLLSGLGKGTSTAFSKTSVSPLGATSTTEGSDVLKSAATQGVGNAFDLMARYHIKRANQYHPVIQVSAGQPVEIIFNAGAWLGEYNQPQDQSDKTETMQSTVENMLGGDND